MKFFTQKTILFKLIVSLCLILTVFSAGFSTISNAEIAGAPGTGDGDTIGSEVGATTTAKATLFAAGGKLLQPIVDLLLALGDGIVEILHKSIMGTEASLTINVALKRIITIISLVVAAVIIGFIATLAGPAIALVLKLGTIGLGIVTVTAAGGFAVAYSAINGALLPDIVVLPIYTISPEELFKGHILLFDVNIFNPKEIIEKDAGDNAKYYYYEDANGNEVVTSKNNSAKELKETISKWYYALRTIAVAALMIVLLYIGIRMLLTSIAEEKAKYKQMMGDWFVAMCLIFLMHYIMVFANNFTESIVSVISNSMNQEQYTVHIVKPSLGLKGEVERAGMGAYVQGDDIIYPTNLMGKARLTAQEQAGTPEYIGYAVAFCVLVLFTVFFLFTYAKRLLWVMFLTVIAPLVAVSYPLDKIGDGKSQAFDMWLKEYIFNLIIQPFHLLLYLVLVGNAFELAGTNIIYTLVAIGFMVPSEKFLRKMFGFDKAATPGFLTGAAGTAVAMAGLSKLSNFTKKGAGSSQGAIGKGIRTSDNETGKALKPDSTMKELEGQLAESSNVGTVGATSATLAEEERRRHADDTLVTGRNNMPQEEYDNEQTELERRQRLEQERRSALGIVEDRPEQMDELNGEEPEEDNTPTREPEGLAWWADNKVTKVKNGIEDRLAKSREGRYILKNGRKYAPLAMKAGIRGATKLATGITGAGIGTAFGIAGGDPKDVGRNMAAGLYAGTAIGEGLNNRVATGATNVRKRYNDHLKDKDPAAYKQREREKFDRNFKNDEEIRNLYQTKLSLKNEAEIDYALEDALKYQHEGVSDNELIIKAMKADIKDENGRSRNIHRADKTRIVAARKAPSLKSQKDKDYAMDKLRSVRGMPEHKVDAVDQVITELNDLGN